MFTDPKEYADTLLAFSAPGIVRIDTIFSAAKQYPQVPTNFWADVARSLQERGLLTFTAR